MVKRSNMQRFITIALSTTVVLAAVSVMAQAEVMQTKAQTIAPTKAQTKEERFYIEDIQYADNMPKVSNTPEYWMLQAPDPFGLQMNQEGLSLLNETFWLGAGTGMQDLMQYQADEGTVSGEVLYQQLRLTPKLLSGYFPDGSPVTQEFCAELTNNIINAEVNTMQSVQYAICTARAQIRTYPSLMPVTEIIGNPNTDLGSVGLLRVNEPMVIQAISADGMFYQVVTAAGSGWVSSDYAAICTGREQWLEAWQYGQSEQNEFLVVLADCLNMTGLDGKEYTATMGTKLQLVPAEQLLSVPNHFDETDYVVRFPKRQADGSYRTVLAAIPQDAEVSVGYPALNTAAILQQAFQGMDRTYSWGSPAQLQDVSGMVRDLYQCFGLELPMQEAGQQVIHADQYMLAHLTQKEKAALLDELSAGTLLFMDNRELLYLGNAGNRHYAIGTLDQIEENRATGQMQVTRQLEIFSLEDTVTAGKYWMDCLETAVVPYSPAKDIAFASMEG